MNRPLLIRQLIEDEGMVLKPYTCTAGKLTIGVGINLDDGITKEEALWLLNNRIDMAVAELDKAIPWWRRLSEGRQRALLNMAYNMGVPRLLGFKKMLAHLQNGENKQAAFEAMNSLWAKQVKGRADRIKKLIEEGK